jgi:hypothetical protein
MPCPFRGGPRYVTAFNSVQGRIRTELYIDYGDEKANTALFTFLHERRDEIESSYGSPLEWAELPIKRASRIRDYSFGDVAKVKNHDAYIDWFFESETRHRNALSGPAEQWNALSRVGGRNKPPPRVATSCWPSMHPPSSKKVRTDGTPAGAVHY